MTTLIYRLPLEPIGKGRPRVTRYGTYTPTKTTHFEDQVRYLTTKMTKDTIVPAKTPCSLEITAYFTVPKSYSKKRRLDCLSGVERPTKKPDIDNVAKAILDGLNPKMKRNKATRKMDMLAHGVYDDDTQVVDLTIRKRYAEQGHIDIRLEW